MKILLWLLIVLTACSTPTEPVPVETAQQPVIYGDDDRLDVFEHPDEALRALARNSIVVMVRNSNIDRSDPEQIVLASDILLVAHGLCPSQRFVEQPSPGDCSGTLIGPDTVLTAGHCISDRTCPQRSYVFDLFYRADGVLETIEADDVYGCQQVLAHSVGGLDYAIVQLDRPVSANRVPVPIRVVDGGLRRNTPVTMIGFPNGIPAKIDSGGHVTFGGVEPWALFMATVDAFGGNSGSGVFDADRNVVGILVSGRNDYVWQGICRVVNQVDDGVMNAERITYAGRALEGLCEGHPDHALCQEPNVCDTDCIVGAERCIRGRRSVCAIDGDDCPVWERDPCDSDQRCLVGACVPISPGDTCAIATPLPIEDAVIEGDFSAHFHALRGSCGGLGPDHVYSITVETPTRLIATLEANEPLLHVRSRCSRQRRELACVPGDEGQSVVDLILQPGETSLIVDSLATDAGDYTLSVEFEVICADCDAGIVDAEIEDAAVDLGPPDVSVFDIAVPDVAPPEPDIAPPVADIAPPRPDVAPPEPDVAPPVADIAPPVADIAPPVADIAPPEPDVAPPEPDVAPPVADIAPPVADIAPPEPDVAPPEPDVAPPVADIAPPRSDIAPPRPDISPPVPDAAIVFDAAFQIDVAAPLPDAATSPPLPDSRPPDAALPVPDLGVPFDGSIPPGQLVDDRQRPNGCASTEDTRPGFGGCILLLVGLTRRRRSA